MCSGWHIPTLRGRQWWPMNSYLSDVDTLMQDDRDGAVFLYSQPSLTATARASGGGCTLRPGMGVDPTLGAVLLLLVVCRTWKAPDGHKHAGEGPLIGLRGEGGKPNLANSDLA